MLDDDGVDETLRVSFAHQKSPISGDAVSPTYSLTFGSLLEDGGLAPEFR
jgi:hypothetical protein